MESKSRVYYASVDAAAANENLRVGSILHTVWDSPTGKGAVWVKTAEGEWTEKFTHAKAYPFPVWEKSLVLTYAPEPE
jgi:hypothetical protein